MPLPSLWRRRLTYYSKGVRLLNLDCGPRVPDGFSDAPAGVFRIHFPTSDRETP